MLHAVLLQSQDEHGEHLEEMMRHRIFMAQPFVQHSVRTLHSVPRMVTHVSRLALADSQTASVRAIPVGIKTLIWCFLDRSTYLPALLRRQPASPRAHVIWVAPALRAAPAPGSE